MTATAECDELSALHAFLVERAGVRSVGLFWPAYNHTVAVWVVRPVTGPTIRMVVPTSQIFLDETDFFDTKKFDPWHQKTIYECTRRDAPDSFEIPKPLFDFFLQQVDKYGGATDVTLQQLRYQREGVVLGIGLPKKLHEVRSKNEAAWCQVRPRAWQPFRPSRKTCDLNPIGERLNSAWPALIGSYSPPI
jgi:hypothetical protein